MPSKVLKAFNVVEKNGPKVVNLPNYDEWQDEQEVMEKQDLPSIDFLLEQEFAEHRERMQQELAEWKKSEEELFQIQLDAEKQRGYQEGYQLGFEDGAQHGLQQYQELLQRASGILESAFQEKAAVIKEAEPFVIELALEVAKKVLQQELQTNKEALLPMIKQSLSAVYETASLSIHVAPEDFPFVQKQREQLVAVVNGKVEVKVLPDYSIQQGGCIIHTSSGSIDARIDVQLSEIKKALLAYQQEDRRE